jgi:hypothetical protein
LPQEFQYNCEFSAIVRHTPRGNRVTETLLRELVRAHNG